MRPTPCCGMRRRLITEQQAKEIYSDYKQKTASESYILTVIRDACKTLDATLEVEPEYNYVGRITFKTGRIAYFRAHKFDINPHASCLTATDKTYTAYFLRQSGFRVPEGLSFFSDTLNNSLESKRTPADACAYADKVGWPVIVKPNDMSQGTLVTRVNDAVELRTVAAEIFKQTNVALVQPIYKGNDYRVVMLDGTVAAAYQRVPLQVQGDGRTSIAALLADKQKRYTAAGRGEVIHFHDTRIAALLKSQGLTLASMPADGQTVRLLDNANLSTGGEAIDVTDHIHPSYRDIARRALKALNLRMGGIDFLAPDLTKPAGDDHVIIEINASPGLRNFASLGPVQYARSVAYYTEIIRKLSEAGEA